MSKNGSGGNIFYNLKHTSDASWTQQYPLETGFGTLRETLSKTNSQRSATKRLPARLWEATVSKCVQKGSQLNSQVVSFFALFFQTLRFDGLKGPQAHPRATRMTQNVAPGLPKSTPGNQKRSLQDPKSSQAKTSQTPRRKERREPCISPYNPDLKKHRGAAVSRERSQYTYILIYIYIHLYYTYIYTYLFFGPG